MEGGLLFLVSMLVIAIAIFFVFFYFKAEKTKVKITEDVIKIDNNIELLNILRTYIGDRNVADLIADYYNQKIMAYELTNKIDVLMKEIYGDDVAWAIKVEGQEISNFIVTLGKSMIKESSTSIPNYADSKPINVELRFYEK